MLATLPRQGPIMLKPLLRLLLKTLFRVEVEGDRNVFGDPRTLIVANHESFLDGLLLGAFLPVDALFVVHAQIASRPLLAPLGTDGRTICGRMMQSTYGLLVASRATRLVRFSPVLFETVMYMFTVSFVSAQASPSPLPASFVIRLFLTTTLPVRTLTVEVAWTDPHSDGSGLDWHGWPVPSSGSSYWIVTLGWEKP